MRGRCHWRISGATEQQQVLVQGLGRVGVLVSGGERQLAVLLSTAAAAVSPEDEVRYLILSELGLCAHHSPCCSTSAGLSGSLCSSIVTYRVLLEKQHSTVLCLMHELPLVLPVTPGVSSFFGVDAWGPTWHLSISCHI